MRTSLGTLLAVLVLASGDAGAQPLTSERPFLRHRGLLRTGERLDGGAGKLLTDRVEIGSRVGAIPLEQFRTLAIATGSKQRRYAVGGAGIGAGSFLVLVIIGALIDASSDTWELHETPVLVASGAIITAMTAVGGAVVGARTPAWESVPLPGRPSAMPMSARPAVGFRIAFPNPTIPSR